MDNYIFWGRITQNHFWERSLDFNMKVSVNNGKSQRKREWVKKKLYHLMIKVILFWNLAAMVNSDRKLMRIESGYVVESESERVGWGRKPNKINFNHSPALRCFVSYYRTDTYRMYGTNALFSSQEYDAINYYNRHHRRRWRCRHRHWNHHRHAVVAVANINFEDSANDFKHI